MKVTLARPSLSENYGILGKGARIAEAPSKWLTGTMPDKSIPILVASYGVFNWLLWLQETTRSVDEEAGRIVARSSGRDEPPCDPDPIAELVRIVAESDLDDLRLRGDAGAHRTGAPQAFTSSHTGSLSQTMWTRGGMVLKRACGELAHASGSIGLEAIAVTGSGDVVRPGRGFAGHSHGAGRMDRWQDRSHPYGARFTDLRVFSELPSLYPEAEAQAKRRVREPEPIPK